MCIRDRHGTVGDTYALWRQQIHREDVLTLEVATLLYSRQHDATLSVLMSRVWKFVIGSSADVRSLCGVEESQVGVSDDCDDDALRNAPLASKCVILENHQ